MKNAVKIKQHDRYDCGAACLSSVAAWYGLKMPLVKIRRLCGCSAEGISIKGIIDGARELGLNGKAYKSEAKNLVALFPLHSPVIAHLKQANGFFHFVTIYKITKESVSVMDPSCGDIRKIPYCHFLEEWSGYIIVLVPGTRFQKENEKTGIYLRLFGILRFHKKELFLSFLGSTALVIIGVSNSLFLQQIIDKAIPEKNLPLLLAISIILFALLILSLYIGYIRNLFLIRNGIKIDSRLILAYLHKIFALPAEFFRQYSAGDFHSRIGDAFKIRMFISDGLISLFISITTLAVTIALMFTYYYKLALLTLSFIPLYTGLYFISGYISKKYNRELAVTGAKFESDVLNGMEGVMSVKHYGAEKLSIEKAEETYTELVYKLYQAGKALSAFGVTGDGLSRTLLTFILVVGGFSVSGGEISTGELVSFYTLCAFFTAPLNSLVQLNSTATEAVVSSERLFEIIDLEDETQTTSPVSYPLPEEGGDLFIRHLSYTYPGRNALFKDLNLIIERNSITAITGESGCGKSTLGALLLRDYALQDGSICIGSRNIQSIPVRQWRKYISIVPQKCHLFNCSLLDNITSGEAAPDIDRIIGICAGLGLEHFIRNLPSGLLTNIGEHGSTLSGGEIQKISVARVLYRNPQIILFDEATSSLDPESEKYILHTIRELKEQGKTIILITHNRNHLKYASKIIDLDAINSNIQTN